MAEQLDADTDRYLQAAALNVAPPLIPSDPLVGGGIPLEQLLRVLGLAANSSDPHDSTESADRHAERDAWTNDAAGTFTEQDNTAAQQLPQLISGITGAITGAAGALLQSAAQIPGQLGQGAQQAIEAVTALMGSHDTSDPVDDPGPDSSAESSTEPTDFADIAATADSSDSAGPPAVAATAPAAAPGPPPPASSATYPSGSTGIPSARVAATPAAVPHATMSTIPAMPMMPPAGMPVGGTESRADSKPDTKQVVTTNRRAGKPVAAQRIRNEAPAGSA